MFNKIVDAFLNIKNTNNNEFEFEVRFGNFVQNKYFDCNVDISFFYRLKKMLKLQCNNDKNHKLSIYTDSFYKSNGDIFRESIGENTERIVIVKKSIKYHNEYDYDIRFNVSSEKNVTNVNNIKLDKKIMIREKERDTFFFNCGKVDLTKVCETNLENDNKKIKFEVEFEITNKLEKDRTKLLDEINNIIKYILQIRHDNYFVMSNSEYNVILNGYKSLTKSSFFIGAQPETLQKDNLNLFYNELYSVTQKADGDRCFLYVNNNKDIYLVDTNLKIIKTYGKSKEYSNVIMDGELLRIKNKMHFMAFDLLIFNNNDIRGKTEFNLIKRLKVLNEIIKDLVLNPQYYLCSCKKYIFKNVFIGSEILLSQQLNKDSNKNTIVNEDGILHETDGLIFTPINEPYSLTKKWIKLLKWKPKELNTIDFLSVKKERINSEKGTSYIWELYVQTVNDKKKMESELFDINALNEKFANLNINKTELVTFKTDFDDSFIDPTTLEPFKDNTVIEYRWDYNLNKFLPLKTRWDKTLNPFKQGNFSSVACSIWNNITNPIENDILFKLNNLNNKDDIYFKNMRRFHNKIKETLFNKYTNSNTDLLELCVGKGGDLHKWIYNNVKYVCGYDMNERSLNECNERYKNLLRNTPHCKFNADFYKLDLRCDNTNQVIRSHTNPKSDQFFNVVSCQFAIHYFMESKKTLDNLISILDTNLQNDGIFMITYMDKKSVDALFTEHQSTSNKCMITYKEDNGNIVYFLKKTLSDNNEKYFGNKLKIFLDGNNVLNECSEEFLVDSDFLIHYLKNRGYTCIESDFFYNKNTSTFSLNNYEKTISSLNMYGIFKKTNTTTYIEPISFTTNKPINLYKQEIYNNKYIDLDKDINLLIVQKTHEIYDLLNCIEYTINLKNYINEDILHFDTIVNCLNSLNKKIIAINLNDANDIKNNDSENNNLHSPNNNLTDEFYYKQSCKKIYIYNHVFTSLVLNENYNPDHEQDSENNKFIEKTFTNWYISLYKHQVFFPENKLNLLNYTNINNVIYAKDNNKSPTNTPPPLAETLAIQPQVVKPQVVEPQEVVQPLEVVEPQVVEPQVVKQQVVKPQVVVETISKELKDELILILDNKPTIKILKMAIEKINKSYSKSIKTSGNKELLIQRIKLEL